MIVMYQSIDEIDVGDYSYENICLNCRYWINNGVSQEMVCDCGKGLTDSDDTCCLFVALNSMGDDYNSYLAKSQKMDIWRSGF